MKTRTCLLHLHKHIKYEKMCPGCTTSTGCGGLLQLPALRLSHCLHHHTLSYCQRQGVLWILLEGEDTHTYTHKLFFFLLFESCDVKGIIHNRFLWSFLLCSPWFVLLSASSVDEEGVGDSPWPQCHLHHVPHYGGEVLSLVKAFLAYF